MKEIRFAKSKVHFIGIGGIGMCGLAELLHNMGVQVQGSDISENTQTHRLRELGVPVFIGHHSDYVEKSNVVVYSSAIKANNVEFQRARELGIPLIPRAEALAEIMRLKRGIAIAGTHGKTTTTSMTASVFLKANLDPTIVVGGRLDWIKSTAQLGYGEWLIAEADESDGSFNILSPEVVIITNIDNDHMDHYKTWDNLKKAFCEFAHRIPFYGSLIVCGDDEEAFNLFKDFPKKKITYGFHERNDFQLKELDEGYEIFRKGEKMGILNVPIAGKHNALNALASVIAGGAAGIPFDICLKGISQFAGVDRRFQFKGEAKGSPVYDDYGHHPTEVSAVLNAFKGKYPDKKVMVLFQPHRYSRTEACWDQFLTSFKDADEVLVLDIYPAGEVPIEGISGQKLAEQMDHNQAKYIASKNEAMSFVKSQLGEDVVFVTLGAGDIWKLGEEIINS